MLPGVVSPSGLDARLKRWRERIRQRWWKQDIIMGNWQRLSTARQLADYLGDEVRQGRWRVKMPGVIRLANELGVSRDSVEAALVELEREGLLLSQGRGKQRIIATPEMQTPARALKVGVLLVEPADRSIHYIVEMIHELRDAGHQVKLAPKTQTELAGKPVRIAPMVEEAAVDAWVVFGGSLEVLEWFAASALPTFALAGRANELPIASILPDKLMPMRLAVRRFFSQGHRRIVLLCRPHRVVPEPGRFEKAFLEELASLGIAIGPYHIRTWDETAEGFHKTLDSLFRYSPPTALVIDEAPPVTAFFQFCMKRGLRVPDDVSLVCTDPDPSFEWSHPSVAHIRWDSRHMIRRVVRWADNIRIGRKDLNNGLFKAHLVEGGTIGPAPGTKS
jgi:DNA-binding LacI/PurR family transcriptional regulator